VVEQVVDVAGTRGRMFLRQRPVGVGGADDPVPAGALAVAAQFSSTVQLIAAGGAGPQADAKSVLAVMQLGASSGQQVTVRAVGPDAEKAVQTLVGILSSVSKVGD
jgi:phosphotransferase system HPr (HPr) family protein